MPFVVYTKPLQEGRARTHLERQGYQVFLPLCRRNKRTISTPLFPRYLFIWVPEGKGWLPVGNTQGVSRVLKSSDFSPTPIAESVIDEIKRRVEADGGSIILEPEEKQREFTPGQGISVVGGTHAGLTGLYVTRKKDRITALFNMFGRQVRATVNEANIA